jgi:flagellar basal body P-ring protein FlgI
MWAAALDTAIGQGSAETMKPFHAESRRDRYGLARCWRFGLGRSPRRRAVAGSGFAIGLIGVLAITFSACTGPVVRTQGLDGDDYAEALEPLESPTELIGDLAHPYGLNYLEVEGVSLVTGLDSTGADPPPGPQRAALLSEMQRRGVAHPGGVLASSETALVLVRGYLRPGIQKGDHFDVEVRVPSRSDVESLRNGWLLSTRLSEMAVLGHQIRSGHPLAAAQGPVLVDPNAKGPRDRPLLTQCRVLGGGVCSKSRSLGIAVDTEYQSAQTSQQIGDAINRRMHMFLAGIKEGVATPKTDQFVELRVHPRYKDNIIRYIHVVRNIAFKETPTNRQARIDLLARQLDDPVTAATAALRLEAIGSDAIEPLKETIAVADQDPEVLFYAAEALAYLDVTDAVAPLAAAARSEPAFRPHALVAISAMDDAIARDALRELLSASSAETRYGAFRALSAMHADDPLVRGEDLKGQFSYHVLKVGGPSMIHVTRSYRPEVVLFGEGHHFKLPLAVDAGSRIMVNGLKGSEITVSRFAPKKADEKRVVSTKVDDVIRAIVELGGTYPDVVQALLEADQSGGLSCRLRVDAVPESGRRFDRSSGAETAKAGSQSILPSVAAPVPHLFRRLRASRFGKQHSGAAS